jgi:hypothetical protein
MVSHKHGLKKWSKTDRFSWKLVKPVSVNRLVNIIFLKKFDFFEKWFTGFGTGLLVIPTGKLVLLAGLPVSAGFNHYRPTSFWFRYWFTSHIDSFTNFWLLKYEIWIWRGFWPIFLVTGHIGGEQFSRPYRFFNPWSWVVLGSIEPPPWAMFF